MLSRVGAVIVSASVVSATLLNRTNPTHFLCLFNNDNNNSKKSNGNSNSSFIPSQVYGSVKKTFSGWNSSARRMEASSSFVARASAQPLKNADKLIDSVETFIFDCDGVIWKGDKLIDGVPETLDMLRSKGKRLVFVTNNSTKSRKQYGKKFEMLGLNVGEEEIFASSFAAAAYLKSINFPKDKKVYVIGEDGILKEMELAGFQYLGGPFGDLFGLTNPGSLRFGPLGVRDWCLHRLWFVIGFRSLDVRDFGSFAIGFRCSCFFGWSGLSASLVGLVQALLWFVWFLRFFGSLLLIRLVFGILLIASLVRLRAVTLWFGDLSDRANLSSFRFGFAPTLSGAYASLVALSGSIGSRLSASGSQLLGLRIVPSTDPFLASSGSLDLLVVYLFRSSCSLLVPCLAHLSSRFW
ncbi:Phosphoric monoester hydrolase, partial [Sarracenia purpurea var. burkii]